MIFIIILALATYGDIIHYRLTSKEFANKTPFRINWLDIQLWAKNHTSADSLFITPPYINGFRTFSERSVFVEKIDAGAMHWCPGFEIQWAKRLNELGYEQYPLLQFKGFELEDPLTIQTRLTYAAISENKFMELAKIFNIDYVIEENFRTLSFPLLYQNPLFTIYKIPK